MGSGKLISGQPFLLLNTDEIKIQNWAGSQIITGALSLRKNHSPERISSVKIPQENTLLIRGTLTDEIQHLSNPFNQLPKEGSEPRSGGNSIDTIRGLVNGILLVLKTLARTVSVDEVFDLIFQVLTQKNTSSTQTSTEAEEIKSLKIGFGAFLGVMKAWGPNLASLQDGKMLRVECNSPEESKMYNQFLQRVFQTTAYTRFCITKNGYVGLVPYRTESGDLVAVFDGSPNQFILRNAAQEEKTEDEIASYRLVGSGCLQHLNERESFSHEPEKHESIRII